VSVLLCVGGYTILAGLASSAATCVEEVFMSLGAGLHGLSYWAAGCVAAVTRCHSVTTCHAKAAATEWELSMQTPLSTEQPC
jgi:hypothetical protein